MQQVAHACPDRPCHVALSPPSRFKGPYRTVEEDLGPGLNGSKDHAIMDVNMSDSKVEGVVDHKDVDRVV